MIVAIENQTKQFYGLQYHPEVKHTDRGMETLKHFLFGIAKLNADWKLENILEEELQKLRQQVGQHLQCCIVAANSGKPLMVVHVGVTHRPCHSCRQVCVGRHCEAVEVVTA